MAATVFQLPVRPSRVSGGHHIRVTCGVRAAYDVLLCCGCHVGHVQSGGAAGVPGSVALPCVELDQHTVGAVLSSQNRPLTWQPERCRCCCCCTWPWSISANGLEPCDSRGVHGSVPCVPRRVAEDFEPVPLHTHRRRVLPCCRHAAAVLRFRVVRHCGVRRCDGGRVRVWPSAGDPVDSDQEPAAPVWRNAHGC